MQGRGGVCVLGWGSQQMTTHSTPQQVASHWLPLCNILVTSRGWTGRQRATTKGGNRWTEMMIEPSGQVYESP
jgi:hypothetical protein